jgi:PAS domain S-box-containing protein
MDSIAPPVRELALIGQLTACAQQPGLLADGERLTDHVVGLLRQALPCEWAGLALHGRRGLRAWASWGRAPEDLAEALRRNGGGGPAAWSMTLRYAGVGVGELLLGPSPSDAPQLEESFLQLLGDQIALLFGLHQHFEDEQQRGRELFTLYENSRLIESAQRLEPMLNRVTENLALALQADRVLIYQAGGAQRPLHLAASYAQETFADVAWERHCEPMLPQLAEIAAQGAPLTLDAASGSVPPEFVEPMAACGVESALLLPMRVKDRTLGLICVGRAPQRGSFLRGEINLGQTMAAQLAASLANARSDADKRRRGAEIGLVHAISRRLGRELSLDETLRAILDGAQELMPFEAAALTIYEPEQQQLTDLLVRNAGSEPPRHRSYPLSEGFKGWLARHRRPLRIDRVDAGAPLPVMPGPHLIGGDDTRSYLGAPLLLDGQFVGTLELASARVAAFDEEDEQLLAIVATQAAQAISNTHRFQQHDAHLRARVLQLAALQRVGRQLTSTLFLPHNLEFVLNEAVRATRASAGTIVLRGSDQLLQIMADAGYIPRRGAGQQFQVMAAVGYSDEERARLVEQPLSPQDPVVAQVLRSSNFVLIDESPTGAGVGQSLLAMPIFYEAQVVGLVQLISEEQHAFDHDAQEFVRALADHTALAIGNAQRYEEQKAQRELLMRRARMLNEVLQIGQALRGDRSLIEVLEQIAFGVVETTSYRSVVFHLLDPDEPELLRVATGAGMPLNDLERLQAGKLPVQLALRYLDSRYRIQRCYFVPAADAQLIALGSGVDDAEAVTANWQPEDEWQPDDILVVPLYSTVGQLLGLMTTGDPATAVRPTAREVEPLEIFADQAAIAVENAQLLQEARERADQMAALYQIGQAATSTLDLDELLERVFQQIVAYLGQPTYFYVALYDQGRDTLNFEIFKQNDRHHPDYHKAQVQRGGLAGWVIDNNRARLVRDWRNEDVPLRATKLDPSPASWIGVPLRNLSGIIGVLSVIHAERFAFDQADLDFLLALGNQLAVALENARLYQEANHTAVALQDRVGELATLLEAARVLSSSLEPQQVLSSLMEVVGRHLAVTTVALWTIKDSMLMPSAMLGIPEEDARRMRVTLGSGLTGRVAAEGQPLVVENVHQEGLSLYPAFNREHNLHSYLGVPVIYQERTVGVLSVMTNERRSFSEDDVALLAGLADQAAIALENARLFAERERQLNELTVLNEIGQAVVATLDQQDVLERLHGGIGHVLDFSTGLIGLYDAARDVLSYPIVYDEGERISLGEIRRPDGVHGWVIRHRQPQLLSSLEEARAHGFGHDWPEIASRAEQIESMLVAPIIAGPRVLGVISVQSYRPLAFSESDLRFVTTVANQAAVALENARLFGETRRSVVELQSLYDNTASLARTLDPEEAQNMVVASVLELLNADIAALLQLDEQGELRLQVALAANGQLLATESEWQSNKLNEQLLASEGPLAIVDYQQLENRHPLLDQAGVRGLLGVGIGNREQRLGALWLATYQPRVWSERQVSLLSIFATQASQALENARLFQSEQAKRRLADTLREVARTLTSSLALDEIQSLILEQLSWVVPYDSASIMLREGEELTITACRGFDAETTARVLNTRFSLIDDPDMLKIIETRQPLLLKDAQMGTEFVAIEGTNYIRGWIGAPLLLNNEVIGVLTVDSHKVGAYDEDDAMVAFALASQGAQAIQNGRLFDALRRTRDELEARVIERTAALATEKERLEVIHRITLELTATLDLEEILQKTLRLISGAVGVRRASIMLRDPGQGELICRAVLHEDGMAVSANTPIRFEGGEGLAGWVMRHQESVIIPDVRRDDRWIQADGRAQDIRSLAAVPLISADEPLGVLILSSVELDFFGEDHLRLLSTIANEVAIAIYNAELYSWLSDIANKLSEALTTQREENSKTFAILRSVSEGVIVLDERKHVALFNPAAEQVLGVPAEAVLDKPFELIGEQGDDEEQHERLGALYSGLWESIEEAADRSAPHALTIELVGQTIAVNVAAVVAPDGTNYGTVAVLRDITREIEADRIKREFVSTVSHELRTPLTSIRGYVDLLLLGAAGQVNENQLTFLNVVKTNANRLMDLINDILAISSIEAGKVRLTIEPFVIDELIREVNQSLKVEIEKKDMTVALNIAPELPQIEGDRKRIVQVVTNLFSNALKYTFEGGKIEVRAYLNPSGMLQVDVQDTGVGISPEQQKLLFTRFTRFDNPLRDQAGGTGLGLNIAKSFVEMHGGEMWVNSALGEGSTFSFVLPLEQPEREEPSEQ